MSRRGSTTRVKGNVSSQFLSALLMALPLAGGGTVEVEGELISKPYVDLTLRLIERFGVTVGRDGYSRFTVEGKRTTAAPGPSMSKVTLPAPAISLRQAHWVAGRCASPASDATASG